MIWAGKKEQTTPSLPGMALEGFRVVVRPCRNTDYSEWQRVRSRNMDRLKTFEPTWMMDALTQDFFSRRLHRHARDWVEDRAYCFLIFDKQEDRLIGGINLNHICRGAAQNASLGYWIDETYEGQGYMAEAGRLVIGYAFDTLKLHRINAACLPDNQRSKNLLARLGFEEEGFAKNYFKINGKWRDHTLFGLVKK